MSRPPANLKRALIYCRVSTQKQEKEATADSQEREARAFAKKHGLAVVRVVHEQHTGAELHERPMLSAERERIRNGEYDVVIFHSVDRLSRNAAHLLIFHDECERAGVQIQFVTEQFDKTPEGTLMLSVKGFVAEMERLKIRERVVRGKRQRVERGKLINASTPLYGYSQDKETSARTIKPSESRIVRRIFDLSLSGVGMRSIAQKLNVEGVPSPANGKRAFKNDRKPLWEKSAISRILREPAYSGLSVAYRWEHRKPVGQKEQIVERPRSEWVILSDSLTPAIVTPEEFDQVQELIAARHTGDATRNESRPYLLRGLIYCGKCGRRRVPDETSYRCGSRSTGKGSCGSPSTPMKMIDEWAWQQLTELLASPGLLESALQLNPAEDQDRERLAQRAAELETAIAKATAGQKRLLDSLADAEGELAGMVTEKIRKLDAEKRSLKPELDSINRRLSAGTEHREQLLEIAGRFRRRAATYGTEEKIALMRAFGVRVMANGREDWRFDIQGIT